MNHRGPAKDLDKVFFLILLVTLLSNSLIYLFAFALNWEAWFFGMKVDGLDAGIILFTYFLISTLLAFLLFRYPRRIPEIALMSIFFFGFKFIDSAETVQEISGGLRPYNEFMVVFLITPLVVLVGHIIVGRFYDREMDQMGKGYNDQTGQTGKL